MNSLRFWRGILFVASLLVVQVISTWGYQFVYQKLPQYQWCAAIFWGISNTEIIVALWFGFRVKSLKGYSTWIRGAAYFIALGYSRMLYYAAQDWFASSNSHFEIPGTTYDSYSGAFIFLPQVLCDILLLWPLSRLCGVYLVDCKSPEQNKPISIAEIAQWTALLAVSIVWIKALNDPNAIETGYSFSSDLQNLKKYVVHAIKSLVPAMILVAMFFAWSRHWLIAVGVLLTGWIFDCLTIGPIFKSSAWLLGTAYDGVLARNSIDRWCYIGGQMLSFFAFSGIAVKLGICMRRLRVQKTRVVTEATPDTFAEL